MHKRNRDAHSMRMAESVRSVHSLSIVTVLHAQRSFEWARGIAGNNCAFSRRCNDSRKHVRVRPWRELSKRVAGIVCVASGRHVCAPGVMSRCAAIGLASADPRRRSLSGISAPPCRDVLHRTAPPPHRVVFPFCVGVCMYMYMNCFMTIVSNYASFYNLKYKTTEVARSVFQIMLAMCHC